MSSFWHSCFLCPSSHPRQAKFLGTIRKCLHWWFLYSVWHLLRLLQRPRKDQSDTKGLSRTRIARMRLGPIGKGSEMLQSRFRSILIPSLGCNINIKPTARTMRIYTKTGDKGTTGLYSGERLPKNHAIFEALGANDELTSHIGYKDYFAFLIYRNIIQVIDAVLQDWRSAEAWEIDWSARIRIVASCPPLFTLLCKVQSRLQDLNSHIATLEGANTKRFSTCLLKIHSDN